MENQTTAVFDFDGTIVSKDTGFEFYKWLTLQSKVRGLLFMTLSPVIIALLFSRFSRKFGLNIACFIATFWQRRSLFALRHAFIQYYFNQVQAVAYTAALQRITEHQQRGDKVIIISGCPAWLLAGVTKHIGIRGVKLIGSKQKVMLGSLLISEHCFSANKIPMAEAAGQSTGSWHTGYSDSRADVPFLNLCQQAVLINVSRHVQHSFLNKLEVPSQFLAWK